MTPEQWMKRAVDVGLLTDGGRLNREQSDAFIDLVVDESVLSKIVRVERVSNPRGELNFMDITEPVTEAVGEDADTGNTYEPILSSVEYDTRKLRSAIDFTSEAFEENIEGDAFRDRVMGAMSKRIATDIELLYIRGSTTTYAADNSRLGRLLRRLNGWYVQGLAGHVVDLDGATISKEVFNDLIQAMPSRYLRNKSDLKFFVGVSTEQEYRNVVANRATGYGDDSLQGSNPMRAFGIDIVPVPLFPENLARTAGTESFNDGSFIWLTNPQNLIAVISRDITIHWEFVPRRDRWQSTIYTRVDCLIENTDAFVMGINLQVEGA